jgi:pyruvate-formate lyase-activating enzyme
MEKSFEEWKQEKKWNPFNSDKLLTQVYRWRQIARGADIPQPALVSIDPANICDLKCEWCNADFIMGQNKNVLPKEVMLGLPKFLANWKGSPSWEKGVEAVCIGGGGESLLNRYTSDLIEGCVAEGIEVGVVTNATHMHKHIPALSKATWIGVSLDAGTNETYDKLKPTASANKKDTLDLVMKNIKMLVEYSKANKTKLSDKGQGSGVSIKYLVYPGNVGEIYEAIKLAKEAGCTNFHARPAATPWFALGDKYKDRPSNHGVDGEIFFNEEDVKLFDEQIIKARELEDENFSIFGIKHKISGQNFSVVNDFKNCHAIFMTAVIMPSKKRGGNFFDVNLCCDRRGDEDLYLGKELTDLNEISDLWSSDKHWEVFDKIQVNKCPRCTYKPHNKIFEEVIEVDNLTYKFI